MAVVRGTRDADTTLVGVLLALTTAAWLLTARRMAGMDAGPASALGGVSWFALTWLLMMAAMMLPALTPMALAYSRRVASSPATAAFAAGYLAVWLAAGLAAYAGIEAVRALHVGFLAWSEAGRYVAAAVVAGAGLYQLSAPKRVCLRRCRERRAFVHEHWLPGRLGALRMGLEHGRDCVGASWAAMAALFALGVMSLTWMAVVAILIAAERMLPRATRLTVALGFVVLGTGVALAPGQMPGFTVPGTTSMPRMQSGFAPRGDELEQFRAVESPGVRHPKHRVMT